MGKLINTAIGAALAFGLINFLKRQDVLVKLTQPDLTPGAWYCYYLGDYLTAHPGEQFVHSSPLQLSNGEFGWATNTPEWDREWFAKRGYEFPAKWVTYSEIEGMAIPMASMGS